MIRELLLLHASRTDPARLVVGRSIDSLQVHLVAGTFSSHYSASASISPFSNYPQIKSFVLFVAGGGYPKIAWPGSGLVLCFATGSILNRDMNNSDNEPNHEDNNIYVDTSGQELDPAPGKYACNACRARKIGCDKEHPCSSCIRSRIDCTYNNSQPIRPKRQRVLISTQYERKIDRIEERLAQVIQLLQSLTTSSTSITPDLSVIEKNGSETNNPREGQLSSTWSSPANSSLPERIISSSVHVNSPSSPAFQGESSMAAHTDFANNFYKRAVRTGLPVDSSVEVDETLSALRRIVDAQSQPSNSDMTYTNARPESPGKPKERPMPPMQLTLSMLQSTKGYPDLEYLWLNGYLSQEQFSNYAVSVYFSPGFTDAEYLIVNVGLFWLYEALTILDVQNPIFKSIPRNELPKQSALCRENIETTLSQLRYNIPNTIDYVIALQFAATYIVEMSKLSLAWSLLASALQICQNLGYHRINSLKKDKPGDRERKLTLFWGIYILEKGLALRLGRPSAIQDYDITVPIPPNLTFDHGALDFSGGHWVRIASIQGRTYELLYSPAALAQNDHTRAIRAQSLADELISLIGRDLPSLHSHPELLSSDCDDGGALAVMILGTELIYFSLLTLIYRAIPVPRDSKSSFTSECIDAARKAVAKHQEAMAAMQPMNTFILRSYIHWSILYVPFIPIIILFCHIIEEAAAGPMASHADLERMGAFVESLNAPAQMTEAAARLQNLLQVLYQVASKYVEIRSANRDENVRTQAQTQTQQELDMYVQALGFGPENMRATASAVGMGYSADAAFTGSFGASGGSDGLTQQQQTSQEGMSMSIGGGGSNESMPPQGAMLGEWFQSNQQILNLLEQDMLNFTSLGPEIDTDH
ncbi:hypothetical protein F4810DRAFT_658849 [Camillea tinctor]|nr:hypothetical protein F4810DRAFT_658849 [Camillea tinctor]